jgi:hypothetical protein
VVKYLWGQGGGVVGCGCSDGPEEGGTARSARLAVSDRAWRRHIFAADELATQHPVVGVAYDQLAGMPVGGAQVRHALSLVEGFECDAVSLAWQRDLPASAPVAVYADDQVAHYANDARSDRPRLNRLNPGSCMGELPMPQLEPPEEPR